MDCQTVRTEVHIEPPSAAVQTHLLTCARCAAYAARFARLDMTLRGELVLAAPAELTSELATLAQPAERQLDRLDVALRDELIVPVPAALTDRLLALVPEPSRVATRADAAVRDSLMLQAPPELTARLQALIPQTAAVPALVPPAPVAPPHRNRWVVASVYFATVALLMLSLLYAGQMYSFVIAQLGLEAWLQQIAALPGQLLTQMYTLVPQSRIVIGTLVWLQQPLQWMLVALLLWAVVDMTQRQPARQYA